MPLNEKELQALRYIRNSFIHRGSTPSIRQLQRELNYSSPNSAAYVINRLVDEGYLERGSKGVLKLLRAPEARRHATTVDIPLVGSVPCGLPLLAEENIEMTIPVSTDLAKPPHKYFLLRAMGDSMDKKPIGKSKGIQEGDILLVKQQPSAETGEAVVALIDDKATVKEYHPGTNAVVLRPRSTNTDHKPIILTDDFCIQGVVVSVLPDLV